MRVDVDEKIELYDLATDLAEQNDLASRNPGVVEKIDRLMKTARTDSAEFPITPRKR